VADFQSLLSDLESEEITLFAGSVDPADKAEEFAEKNGITFPLFYGINAEEVSRITGAYYDRDRQHVHATGFLIRPDNAIAVACYSTGPIGRFMANDVLGLVKFYKSTKK
jgi:peroxiredoxin